MDENSRAKILSEWLSGAHRPPPLPKRNGHKKPYQPMETVYKPVDGITCYCGDFRSLPLPDATVDCICTDIPWATDWLRNVEEFAVSCARMLKPGGIMVTLYTPNNLDRLLERLSRHLTYVWLCASPMHGNTHLRSPFITRSMTLAVVYSKGPPQIPRSPCDLLPSSWRDSTRWHEHQQSLPVVQYLIEHFSEKGDLVGDLCSGGWTTAEACWRTGRRFVGSDNRVDCLEVARHRFASILAAEPH